MHFGTSQELAQQAMGQLLSGATRTGPAGDAGAPPELGLIEIAGAPPPALPEVERPMAGAGIVAAIVIGLGAAVLWHLSRRRLAALPLERRIFHKAANRSGLSRADRRAVERLAGRAGVPAVALLLSDGAMKEAAAMAGRRDERGDRIAREAAMGQVGGTVNLEA
ncbi:MAG: hypothetical protein AAGI17_01100 [Planctomycetota bacterium]